jgi:hypothetical protein
VSLVDMSLSRTVTRNISKTVRLFCLKCEQMIVTDGEATQVIGKFITCITISFVKEIVRFVLSVNES